jgi:hypothetical protein
LIQRIYWNNYSIAIILNRPQFPNGKYQWTCHFPVCFFLLSWETGTGDFHALFRSRRSIGVCIRSSSGNQSNDNILLFFKFTDQLFMI